MESQFESSRGITNHSYDQEESAVQAITMKSTYGSINEDVIIDDNIEEEKINNLQCLMNFLKGYVGTGILAIPSAFKYGGLLVSMAGIFLIGIITTHCVHMLVSCSRYVERRYNKKRMDYGKLAEEVFSIGPPQLQPYSRAARIVVNVFLCLTQFGFCAAYIVFMASNAKFVVENYAGISWSPQIYQCLIVLLLIPYLTITNLRILAFFSGIANMLVVFGLSVILYTCFNDLPPVSSRPFVGSWFSFPLYFGIVIFSFEGIGVVIPLDNKMKTPKDFTGWCGLINLGMTIVTCLIAGVGFFGYLKYGEGVKDSITSNFPNTVFYNIVNICFVLAIFCTYGVQFYVPIEFLWMDTKPKLKTGSFMYQHGEYFMKFFFLIVTFILAAAVPHLDLMISLIGALASTAVALLFPALLDILCSFQIGYGIFRWKLIKDVVILLFGLLCFITGTGTTLYQIVMTFEKTEP